MGNEIAFVIFRIQYLLQRSVQGREGMPSVCSSQHFCKDITPGSFLFTENGGRDYGLVLEK